MVEIVGARSGGTQGGIVAPDGARSTFVVPLMATKAAAASNKLPGLFTRDYLSTPWSRPNDQERRLQAYSPTLEHIGIFLSAIQQFAPKNLTGGWLDRISRDLVLTGDNQTVRKVEKSSSRAHIFKSDTDHLSVFIANSGRKPEGHLRDDPLGDQRQSADIAKSGPASCSASRRGGSQRDGGRLGASRGMKRHHGDRAASR